jgi:protein associated with RNAse G/E
VPGTAYHSISCRTIVWREVKFDGSLHRSATVVDLGTNGHGRWLFLPHGTQVTQSGGRSFDHPCDATALIPADGMWTAVWLAGWDPDLYIDIARVVSVGDGEVVTMDLDVDVVRRPGGEVDVLDLDEFELHRERYGYPDDLVRDVERATAEVSAAVADRRPPFLAIPAVPRPPRHTADR